MQGRGMNGKNPRWRAETTAEDLRCQRGKAAPNSPGKRRGKKEGVKRVRKGGKGVFFETHL